MVALDENITGLAVAIEALREELAAAIAHGEGSEVKFRISPVELTVQVAVTKGVDGKIGWGVLGIGGTVQAATTHVLKLQLEPLLKTTAGDYSKDFTVASETETRPKFGPRRGAANSTSGSR
jgi:hypothetical protein